MVTSLLLVRHGQSTWNAERRWQGQADPPLSALGRDQARLAAATLDNLVERFDAAASSPQQRAAETADLLVASAGSTSLIDEVVRFDGLKERSAGPWSGLTKDDIDQHYPGYLTNDRRPDGYESDDSLFERTHASLLAVGERWVGQTVLVVCHGGVINTLVSRLGNTNGRTPNLSGYRATVTGAAIEIGERVDLLGDAATGGDAIRI